METSLRAEPANFYQNNLDRNVCTGTGLNSFNDSEQHISIAVQTKVAFDKTTRKGAFFVMTETLVQLP